MLTYERLYTANNLPFRRQVSLLVLKLMQFVKGLLTRNKIQVKEKYMHTHRNTYTTNAFKQESIQVLKYTLTYNCTHVRLFCMQTSLIKQARSLLHSPFARI